MLYIHRYLRLTPLFAMTFLVTMTLLRFMGDGPFWPIFIGLLSSSCGKYWWSALLYVQNYVNPTEIVSEMFELTFDHFQIDFFHCDYIVFRAIMVSVC